MGSCASTETKQPNKEENQAIDTTRYPNAAKPVRKELIDKYNKQREDFRKKWMLLSNRADPIDLEYATSKNDKASSDFNPPNEAIDAPFDESKDNGIIHRDSPTKQKDPCIQDGITIHLHCFPCYCKPVRRKVKCSKSSNITISSRSSILASSRKHSTASFSEQTVVVPITPSISFVAGNSIDNDGSVKVELQYGDQAQKVILEKTLHSEICLAYTHISIISTPGCQHKGRTGRENLHSPYFTSQQPGQCSTERKEIVGLRNGSQGTVEPAAGYQGSELPHHSGQDSSIVGHGTFFCMMEEWKFPAAWEVDESGALWNDFIVGAHRSSQDSKESFLNSIDECHKLVRKCRSLSAGCEGLMKYIGSEHYYPKRAASSEHGTNRSGVRHCFRVYTDLCRWGPIQSASNHLKTEEGCPFRKVRDIMYEVLTTLLHLHRKDELQYEITTKTIFVQYEMKDMYGDASRFIFLDAIPRIPEECGTEHNRGNKACTKSTKSDSSRWFKGGTRRSLPSCFGGPPFDFTSSFTCGLEFPANPIFSMEYDACCEEAIDYPNDTSKTPNGEGSPYTSDALKVGKDIKDVMVRPLIPVPISDMPNGGISIKVPQKFKAPLVGYTSASTWPPPNPFEYQFDEVWKLGEGSSKKKASLKSTLHDAKSTANRCLSSPYYPPCTQENGSDSKNITREMKKGGGLTNDGANGEMGLPHSGASRTPVKEKTAQNGTREADKGIDWDAWDEFCKPSSCSLKGTGEITSSFRPSAINHANDEDGILSNNEKLLNFTLWKYAVDSSVWKLLSDRYSSAALNFSSKKGIHCCLPTDTPSAGGAESRVECLSPATDTTSQRILPICRAFVPNLPLPMIFHDGNYTSPISKSFDWLSSRRFVPRLQHNAMLHRALLEASYRWNMEVKARRESNRNNKDTGMVLPPNMLPEPAATKKAKHHTSFFIPVERYITPDHIAPEVLLGEPFSEKSDVYAWAITFIELVKNQMQKEGKTNDNEDQKKGGDKLLEDNNASFPTYSDIMLKRLGIHSTCLPDCLPKSLPLSPIDMCSTPLSRFPSGITEPTEPHTIPTPLPGTPTEEDQYRSQWALDLRDYFERKKKEEDAAIKEWRKDYPLLALRLPEAFEKYSFDREFLKDVGRGGWCRPTPYCGPLPPGYMTLNVRRLVKNGLIMLCPPAVPIPAELPSDYRTMLQWCLQLDPHYRPSVSELMCFGFNS